MFCLSEESQRVCNNEPSIIPCNRGTREGSGEVFYGSTHSRTLYIVSLLIIVWWPTVVLKDVSLSIKKYKIFFIPDICCLLCFLCRWCWFSNDSYCLHHSWPTHCHNASGLYIHQPTLTTDISLWVTRFRCPFTTTGDLPGSDLITCPNNPVVWGVCTDNMNVPGWLRVPPHILTYIQWSAVLP